MSLLTQKTVKDQISFNGVGLHTGLPVSMKILPAKPNTGIIFKRIDISSNNIVIPNFNNVVDATLCTTISNQNGVKVSTIEHLMAGLYGLGVDNAIIELNNQELPILDGSAKEFVEKIIETGIETSNEPIKVIKIERKIKIQKENKFISIDKSKVGLNIDFEINFPNKLVGIQRNKINILNDDLREIYSSRTFCLYEDIEKLKKMGLGKGGSLENAIVVKDDKILNENGLRNNLEFVNHKILDCIGDLYLSGFKLIASIECSQGGHSLTNELLREVFKDKKNFSIFEIKEKNLPHTFVNNSYLKSIA